MNPLSLSHSNPEKTSEHVKRVETRLLPYLDRGGITTMIGISKLTDAMKSEVQPECKTYELSVLLATQS